MGPFYIAASASVGVYWASLKLRRVGFAMTTKSLLFMLLLLPNELPVWFL